MNTLQALGRLAGIAVGLAGAAYAADSHAANVGYYRACGASGDISGVVAAGGRTVVPVTTLDAATLSGLDALVITVCPGGYLRDPDVDNAVSNGMGLVFERLYQGWPRQDSTQLPGSPTFGSAGNYAWPEADNIELAAGAPIVTGVGGTLTSTSLDRVAPSYGWFNMVHWYPRGSLPAGSIPLLTTSNPDRVGAFAYNYGAGRVVYTDTQWTLQLPGGEGAANVEAFAAGGAVFLANAIDWVAIPLAPSFTTCAAEGYKGAKLTLCQKICESNITGSTLNGLIRTYVAAYREQPACVR